MCIWAMRCMLSSCTRILSNIIEQVRTHIYGGKQIRPTLRLALPAMVNRGEPNVKTGLKTTDGAPLQDPGDLHTVLIHKDAFIHHASRPLD